MTGLRDPATRADDREPERLVPWLWRHLDEAEREDEWKRLLGWVDAWTAAYEIGSRIPVCWSRHGAVVEHLIALHRAYLEATLPIRAQDGEVRNPPATALCSWQNVLMPATLEVLRRESAGCGADGGHVTRRLRRAVP